MKAKMHLKTVYVMAVLSVFLPWFTYNAKIMGYCWGFHFLNWFFIPFIVIGVYLFLMPQNRNAAIAAQFGAAVNLAILVYALGSWLEVRNISGGFNWTEGLRTAQPGYWIAAAVHLLLIFMLLVNFAMKQNRQ